MRGSMAMATPVLLEVETSFQWSAGKFNRECNVRMSRKKATFEVAFFRLILTLHSRLNFPADHWKLVSTSNKTGVAIAMEPRIAYTKYSSNALHALYALEKHIKASGLEEKLLHLIKLRASQINGCAYCIDMHSKDARAAGDTEMRLYALNAWRETPFFTPRERAALAWTEKRSFAP